MVMAIDYVCMTEKRLVLVVWDQRVTVDQWRAHLQRMFADPCYARADAQLADLRYSTIDASVTEMEIHRIVDTTFVAERNLLAHKRLAIVAGPDWEKPKLVEQLIEPLNVRPIVFTNLVTACTWLSLEVVEIGNALKEMRLNLRQAAA
jgi:hypothetical protein